jgi:hypothetical protein
VPVDCATTKPGFKTSDVSTSKSNWLLSPRSFSPKSEPVTSSSLTATSHASTTVYSAHDRTEKLFVVSINVTPTSA